jgi:hypothetical protein
MIFCLDNCNNLFCSILSGYFRYLYQRILLYCHSSLSAPARIHYPFHKLYERHIKKVILNIENNIEGR